MLASYFALLLLSHHGVSGTTIAVTGGKPLI
jgi:hypothetical protein